MLKKIDRLLSKISISQKIIIIFLGSALIPLFMQAFYNLAMTEQRLQNEITQRMENALADRAKQIQQDMGDTVSLTLRYYNNERIYQWLDKDYLTDYEYLLSYQQQSQEIKEELPYHQQIKSIQFYTDNATIFNGNMVSKVEDATDFSFGESFEYCYDAWIDREDGDLLMRTVVSSNQGEREISILRKLNRYSRYGKNGKVLKINLTSRSWEHLLSDTELFDAFYVVTTDNKIIYSTKLNNQTGEYETYDEDLLPEGFVGLKKKVADYPLYIYGKYDTRLVSDQFRQGRFDAISVFVIGLAIAGICICFVGKNITDRTRKIEWQAMEIAKGNFVVSESAQYSKDEIGRVENSINHLSIQLQEYIDREYKAELTQTQLESETNQAKLQALQSQVNPHFLFNTLESIRLKAQVRQELETATMIKYMSRMFRYIIDWTDEVVPLCEDLKFLDEFLAIQKYRFEDEFTYKIHVDEGAEQVYLPKMLIQPLVENACVHGVESVADHRQVTLEVTIQGQMLDIRVGDNGGGISQKKLDELNNMFRDGSKTYKSVGLSNVYQRLKLYYGAAFHFKIESIPGEGTLCIMQIPMGGALK
ncbi:sensor histidine kinase [Scatolibacter rhodanostii]|uniref:sensor histidine kinase n=1 Tax=Scatolibacter rhodanostii TaxID=2014781 RepID=UPI000C072587|nr:sensor histidine kinase [Scatolibacter rhodanostii]